MGNRPALPVVEEALAHVDCPSGASVTRCLGVCPGLGFGFRVGVPGSRMGWDGASASGLLRRLVFRIRYLAIGGGHIVGRNGEAVDSEDGDRHKWRVKHRGW